jgi:hypothetical protein
MACLRSDGRFFHRNFLVGYQRRHACQQATSVRTRHTRVLRPSLSAISVDLWRVSPCVAAGRTTGCD